MAKLKFTIEGDATSSDRAINSTTSKLKGIASTVRKTSTQFAKYGSIVTGVATGILVATTKQSLAHIDSLAKTSDQLGITTEKLVAFQHLGELTGVSQEKMGSSLERMTKRLGEAAQGMGAARPQLERLNLSAKELVKLSPDQQYEAIAESIKGLNTQSEKAASVAAIFGREGLALLNTIEAGAEGFRQAEEDVRAFGTAISRTDAAKVEEANDAFERVQEALKGVSTRLTVQLAPILKVISDRFVNAARESGGFSDQLLAGINASIEGVAFFADVLRGLETVWKLVEVAAHGFFSLTLTGLDELQKAAAGALSWIPGVDVAPSSALSEWAEESRQALMETNEELAKLIDEPMPSTNIKQFFADVTKEADEAAIAIAASKEAAVAPVEEEAESRDEVAIQKTIEANEVKYQRLREMAEQFQNSEEEREILRMERENEQFNLDLERMVEQGATVDEALEVQRLARIDAEAIHQNNMLEIKDVASKEGRFSIQADAEKTLAILAVNNKKAFRLQKAISIAKSAAALPSAVMQSFERGGGYPWGLIPAGLMAARGAAEISSISKVSYTGQAHGGIDNVPSDSTFLLKKGEMVLDPGTSEEVRQAAKGGGQGGAVSLVVNINYPMFNPDWDAIAENNIKPAFDRLFDRDVFLEGVEYSG